MMKKKMFKKAKQAQGLISEFANVWDEWSQKFRDAGFEPLGFYNLHLLFPDNSNNNKLHWGSSDWINNIKSPELASELFKPILENAEELRKHQCEFVEIDGKSYCKTCAENLEKGVG